MTDPEVALSARARRLAAIFAAWPRRRVRLAELWKLLDEADPATRTDVRRRSIMSEVIVELHAAQVIELPSAQSYDRTEAPPLPRFVALPRPDDDRRPPQPVVWNPALSWVLQARISRAQEETLRLVNHWLYHNRDEMVVPSRERSLEIFGDEKALDRLIGTTLFGPGRLDLSMLRCRRIAPPLHWEQCGDGGLLLVIENSDTFDSILTALRSRDGHRVGLVAWGAGTGFEASVFSIGRTTPPIAEVRYFGDLDENGLRVPSNAAVLAGSEGLPAIRPATGLYTAMLRLGIRQPSQRKVSDEAASHLANWLDQDHQETAIRLLTSGDRIAQEAVGLAHLSRHEDWLCDLH
jgi:hypothetical protein